VPISIGIELVRERLSVQRRLFSVSVSLLQITILALLWILTKKELTSRLPLHTHYNSDPRPKQPRDCYTALNEPVTLARVSPTTAHRQRLPTAGGWETLAYAGTLLPATHVPEKRWKVFPTSLWINFGHRYVEYRVSSYMTLAASSKLTTLE